MRHSVTSSEILLFLLFSPSVRFMSWTDDDVTGGKSRGSFFQPSLRHEHGKKITRGEFSPETIRVRESVRASSQEEEDGDCAVEDEDGEDDDGEDDDGDEAAVSCSVITEPHGNEDPSKDRLCLRRGVTLIIKPSTVF